ncbi:MAG: hypothetical protein VKK42_21825 [Lyngbya sp.]|nr:hypothetical protein [Lyngbya sp.]
MNFVYKNMVAGTGSRSLVKDYTGMAAMVEILARKIIAEGVDYIISGMAEGFDEALAKAAILTKTDWCAAIPNPGYGEYYWGRTSQTGRNRIKEFEELVNQSTDTQYICDGIYSKGRHSNFIRNEWMMDAANKVWVFNPASRGTAHAYKYCLDNNIPTEIITLESNLTI